MTFRRTFRLPSRRLDRHNKFSLREKRRSTLRISHRQKVGLSQKNRRHQVLKPGAGKAARSRHLPRVGKHWRNKPDVIVHDDGREVCNRATQGGQFEYKYRVWLMWVRQDGWCCNCPYKLSMSDASFEHEDGRTKARRDDRIAIFDKEGRFVRHINGASHSWCNVKRGSKRTAIWHGNNAVVEVR